MSYGWNCKNKMFFREDMSFMAKEEDYKILKEVWLNIIKSWIDITHLKKIDIKERIFYLPENCQYIYWKVCEQKKSISRDEAKEIATKAMSLNEYFEAWNILIDMGVFVESDGLARPHYISELKDGEQSRLQN